LMKLFIQEYKKKKIWRQAGAIAFNFKERLPKNYHSLSLDLIESRVTEDFQNNVYVIIIDGCRAFFDGCRIKNYPKVSFDI